MPKNLLSCLVIAALPLTACGATETDTGGGDDDANGQPPPGGTVVPEGLDLSFIPGRDMELVALTLQEGIYGPEILVAMRNPGTEYLCEAEFRAAFGTTAANDMGELGVATLPVLGFMYETPEPMNCIAPGEIGFGATDGGVNLYGEFQEITRVYYQFRGYLYPAPTRLSSVTVQGITPSSGASSGTTLSGSIQNGWTASLVEPEILIFSLNDAGRPLGWGAAYEYVEVPPGATWNFEALVPGPLFNPTPRFRFGGL